MGSPVFETDRVPVSIPWNGAPILNHPIEVSDTTFEAAILSMGNPHCVIFVDQDPSPLPRRYGPTLETHPLFPAKTNVEFIQVLDGSRLKMRVWERGSGETFSCGTGACAAAVAGNLKGLVGSRTEVNLLGGELEIEWKNTTSPVVMTGAAILVYNGVIIL